VVPQLRNFAHNPPKLNNTSGWDMRSGGFLALVCALFGGAASAQEGIYVGIGLGNFDYQENFVDPLLGRVSDNVSTTKIFGGFEINDFFAIEINYAETSDISRRVSGVAPVFGNFDYTFTTDFTMTSLKAVGQYPKDWGVLLGGLGYYTSDNDFRETAVFDCCGTDTNAGEFRDNGLAAMLGIEWRFGRFGARYGVRLEYEWWDIDLLDTSAAGLAFSYGF
jgi:hypothetical protein